MLRLAPCDGIRQAGSWSSSNGPVTSSFRCHLQVRGTWRRWRRHRPPLPIGCAARHHYVRPGGRSDLSSSSLPNGRRPSRTRVRAGGPDEEYGGLRPVPVSLLRRFQRVDVRCLCLGRRAFERRRQTITGCLLRAMHVSYPASPPRMHPRRRADTRTGDNTTQLFGITRNGVLVRESNARWGVRGLRFSRQHRFGLGASTHGEVRRA